MHADPRTLNLPTRTPPNLSGLHRRLPVSVVCFCALLAPPSGATCALALASHRAGARGLAFPPRAGQSPDAAVQAAPLTLPASASTLRRRAQPRLSAVGAYLAGCLFSNGTCPRSGLSLPSRRRPRLRLPFPELLSPAAERRSSCGLGKLPPLWCHRPPPTFAGVSPRVWPRRHSPSRRRSTSRAQTGRRRRTRRSRPCTPPRPRRHPRNPLPRG
jgi:hypothetical protein